MSFRSFSLRKLPYLAWPALVFLLIVAPAIVVLFFGRDVDALDFGSDVSPNSIAAMSGRISTAAILLMGLIVVLLAPPANFQTDSARRRYRLLGCCIAFFAIGHVLLPGFLGAEPVFKSTMLYAIFILLAAYRAQALPSKLFLGAAKWGLLILMIGGFVIAVIQPEVALQTQSKEIRLGFVAFRYWGLGSSPNNIAPLALLLVLLTLHTPFKSRLVTGLALVSAGATLLLAQSQTTWAATLIVLPIFTIYRFTPKPIRSARINPLVLFGLSGALVAGCAMLIWQASTLDSTSLYSDKGTLSTSSLYIEPSDSTETFTGRTAIWQVAMDTWQDYPWFGYGPSAWGLEFRQSVGMPFASNAHNQAMQSVSVGGNVALLGLMLYVLLMFRLGWSTLRQCEGLALACITVLFIRGLTEAPLDTNTLLSGEVLFHVSIIYLLCFGLRRYTRDTSPKRRRQRRARTSKRRSRVLAGEFKPEAQAPQQDSESAGREAPASA